MPTIQTVTGPVDAADLGPTSVHEHLLIDLGVWFDPPADPEAERAWQLGQYPAHLPDVGVGRLLENLGHAPNGVLLELRAD